MLFGVSIKNVLADDEIETSEAKNLCWFADHLKLAAVGGEARCVLLNDHVG